MCVCTCVCVCMCGCVGACVYGCVLARPFSGLAMICAFALNVTAMSQQIRRGLQAALGSPCAILQATRWCMNNNSAVITATSWLRHYELEDAHHADHPCAQCQTHSDTIKTVADCGLPSLSSSTCSSQKKWTAMIGGRTAAWSAIGHRWHAVDAALPMDCAASAGSRCLCACVCVCFDGVRALLCTLAR